MIDKERIIEVNIEEEMKKSYLAYSMSVIISRALPDVRDGLKPVHRRILYAMKELGLDFRKSYKKSARIVGEVLGKYHPHGDSAVYDAMVRMVQDFSLRYPLVEGQGNFGSIDGDSAAAMRYTEAKMSKITQLFLQDIEKNTVNFIPNFDDTLEEPSVLPVVIPNILLNGASGIAVGMSTNIPPHNIKEIINATIYIIEHPECEVDDLIKLIKGPDFPTGAMIVGTTGIHDAYRTGRGRIIVRARTVIESLSGNKNQIVVTELPYQVNKANLIEKIADMVKNKKIEGISDIRDESDRDGIRVVIELKRDAVPQVVVNNLYKHSQMQVTFGAILLMLVDKEPKILNIKEILWEFLKFRKDVLIRRTKYELENAEKRAHILEGLKIALANIDEVIAIIKKSPNPQEAKLSLMNRFELSEIQAQAILDMRLQRLTSLEVEKIENEYLELIKLINHLKEVLANETLQWSIIKDELLNARNEYKDERRTEIVLGENDDYEMEDLIAEENVVITITRKGYIKRNSTDGFRNQKRGGRGITGMNTNDDDYVQHLFIASTHDHLLIFTNKGKVYSIKVYQIPEGSRISKGKAIINLVEMEQDEKITAYINVREFNDTRYIVMATKSGIIKKTSLDQFENIRKGGIKAILLQENDSLIGCELTNGNMEIVLGSYRGKAIRFNENHVRSMGRATRGVLGARLSADDYIVGMISTRGDNTLLSVTEKGFAKRSALEDYRITARGGKGIINMKYDEKRGNVIALREVKDNDEVMMITKKGVMIRTNVHEVSVVGRNSKGVKVINLSGDDELIDITPIVSEDNSLIDKE